eukprot:TRINITY_DN5266_c0_g1_i4.p1 TRINITY_DN5266_c0_g1~~TRINITY_DN5266_c0_g1_i4.p1  ORF type:complete len:215 (-),score=61.00 TRINITY_DN5266_c0_g1_i4:74-718(-)
MMGKKIKAMIIAGSADLKHELMSVLYPPLRDLVVQLIDVEYSGDRGFHQAISQAADILKNVTLLKEKSLISDFMTNLASDTNLCIFGPNTVMKAMKMGVVQTMLVDQDSNLLVANIVSDGDNDGDREQFVIIDSIESGRSSGLEIKNTKPLVEWMIDNCPQHGAEVKLVTGASPEGHQFCAGFGGLGAFLRYPVEIEEEEEIEDDSREYDEEAF